MKGHSRSHEETQSFPLGDTIVSIRRNYRSQLKDTTVSKHRNASFPPIGHYNTLFINKITIGYHIRKDTFSLPPIIAIHVIIEIIIQLESALLGQMNDKLLVGRFY